MSGVLMADEATGSELLKALEEDPEDEETLLVYADWLQARGEPRGELIVLQHRREQCPDDRALAAAERALLHEQVALLGGVDRFPEAMQLEWRVGFVRVARIYRSEPEPPPGPPPYTPGTPPAADLLRALLRHPAARLLRELRVSSFDDLDLRTALSVLVEAGQRRTLRRLALEDIGERVLWEPTSLGELDALWPLYPGLRDLYLQADQLELGSIDLPELQSLELRVTELTQRSARSLARARWPQLEWLGLFVDSCQVSPEELRPILGDGTPRLQELALTNYALADAFFVALVASPLAARLAWLDLSGGSFSNASARLLLASRDRFPQLHQLLLERCLVSGPVADRLRTAFRGAMISHRGPGGDDTGRRRPPPDRPRSRLWPHLHDDKRVGKRFVTDIAWDDGPER